MLPALQNVRSHRVRGRNEVTIVEHLVRELQNNRMRAVVADQLRNDALVVQSPSTARITPAINVALDEALKKGSIEAELLGHLGAHNRSELLGIARQNNDGLAGRGRGGSLSHLNGGAKPRPGDKGWRAKPTDTWGEADTETMQKNADLRRRLEEDPGSLSAEDKARAGALRAALAHAKPHIPVHNLQRGYSQPSQWSPGSKDIALDACHMSGGGHDRTWYAMRATRAPSTNS